MLTRCATPVARNRSQSLALDGGLVADRERGQHAGGARIGHPQPDRVAHALAQALDRVRGTVVEALRRAALARAHVATGTDSLLEQPQLEVEAVRVERAVRRPAAAP